MFTRPSYNLIVQSERSIFDPNDVLTGTISLHSQQPALQNLELRLYQFDQFGNSRDQKQLFQILLSEKISDGDIIPFCVPLGGFQLQPTLNFQQIFLQTRIGFNWVLDGKREETSAEIIIRGDK